MKIAYVYDNVYPYYVGGVEKRIWEIGRRLSAKGHEVHWYCMKYWEEESVIYRDGMWLHGVCHPQQLFVNGRRSIYEALFFASKLLVPLMKHKFDIIDVQNFPYFSVFTSKFYSLVKRSQLVITWHEVWDKYWYEYLGILGFFGFTVERMVSLSSGNMLAVSKSTITNLKKISFKKSDIELMPNGIDLKYITNINPKGDVYDVIFAGRLIKEKGVHLLVEAIKIIKKIRPKVKCLIIGDGPEKNNIINLIKDLKLEENIKLSGFINEYEDLIAQIKQAKVFVLPSIREGFGMVVLEANASGIPVVTVNHNQNAAKDLIVEGINGLISLVTPADLAKKILVIINGGNVYKEQCISFAEQYDWGKIVDLLECYYIKLNHANNINCLLKTGD